MAPSAGRARRWRAVAWGSAALLLLLPLIAMQFTDEVAWTVADFAVFGAMLVGVGGTCELTLRTTANRAYRAAVGVALVAAFMLVWVNGAVGIIGNGAGLVMSTLDVVAYAGEKHGGVKPANFLDIGGGASAEVMANGLDVILGDSQVKSVFVNVFGGITACDAVATAAPCAVEAVCSSRDLRTAASGYGRRARTPNGSFFPGH